MPPKIHVSGAVPRDDILWVIEDITWETDDVIWDVIGGTSVRLRQSATVHLLEFVDDDVIVTAPSPAVVAGGGKKSTTKPGAGKTAKQLAQEAYSNPGFWQTIIGANPWLSPDPRVPIPPNKTVVIPPSPKTK